MNFTIGLHLLWREEQRILNPFFSCMAISKLIDGSKCLPIFPSTGQFLKTKNILAFAIDTRHWTLPEHTQCSKKYATYHKPGLIAWPQASFFFFFLSQHKDAIWMSIKLKLYIWQSQRRFWVQDAKRWETVMLRDVSGTFLS